MARAGLLDHRKFKKLVHLLRDPIPHCVGYLECLWTVAYQSRSAFIGDSLDVGLATQFPGEPEKICNALAAAGFIDKLSDGAFEVHDLEQHAPQHVRRAIEKRRKADQQLAKSKPSAEIEPDNGQSLASQRLAKGQLLASKENREERIEKREEKNSPLPPFFASIPEPLKSSPQFVQSWTDWTTHRQEKKAKLTKTAATKQLAKLANIGLARAIAALEHSTANGYSGIFEPKPNGANGSKPTCRVPSDQEVKDWGRR
jgi:hypothetical protein